MSRPLLIATRNPGKLAEIRALVLNLGVTVVSADELDGAPEVEEDAATLEGNAEKKARTLHRFAGLPTLADDTGLEVRALQGRPGVHSARFAGPRATDADNRARLLEALAGAGDRSAQFRTVLSFVTDDRVLQFEGICSGRILQEERGSGGFGYDALFVPDGEDLTFAEMAPEAKNRLSHRGRALGLFRDYLSKEGAPW